uniref:Uncharacterized protein n=1 Tax=viral metagenome TaxID=1070528 RepID=A0A6C0CY10_9ZZZZ
MAILREQKKQGEMKKIQVVKIKYLLVEKIKKLELEIIYLI